MESISNKPDVNPTTATTTPSLPQDKHKRLHLKDLQQQLPPDSKKDDLQVESVNAQIAQDDQGNTLLLLTIAFLTTTNVLQDVTAAYQKAYNATMPLCNDLLNELSHTDYQIVGKDVTATMDVVVGIDSHNKVVSAVAGANQQQLASMQQTSQSIQTSCSTAAQSVSQSVSAAQGAFTFIIEVSKATVGRG